MTSILHRLLLLCLLLKADTLLTVTLSSAACDLDDTVSCDFELVLMTWFAVSPPHSRSHTTRSHTPRIRQSCLWCRLEKKASSINKWLPAEDLFRCLNSSRRLTSGWGAACVVYPDVCDLFHSPSSDFPQLPFSQYSTLSSFSWLCFWCCVFCLFLEGSSNTAETFPLHTWSLLLNQEEVILPEEQIPLISHYRKSKANIKMICTLQAWFPAVDLSLLSPLTSSPTRHSGSGPVCGFESGTSRCSDSPGTGQRAVSQDDARWWTAEGSKRRGRLLDNTVIIIK